MTEGSGGLAAISVGLPWWAVALVLVIAVLGVVKLAKVIWAMFGS
jgi:hypothetical protein